MPADSLDISVDCLPGGGDLVLPSSVDEQSPALTREHQSLAGVSAIVVEDDAPSARLLRLLLSNAGASVRTAHSAEEALELLAGGAARLFVVDLILPGASGLLLARQVRDLSPRSLVVAVSVAHGPEVERHAIDCGCVALIHKPIDVNTFVPTIAHLLGRQEAA
jgi:CheY-like chemotaxis protein